MTAPEQQAAPDVRQVVVHPAVWPHLEAWLAGRGLLLVRMPDQPDDLPTYVMQPTDELLAAIVRERKPR